MIIIYFKNNLKIRIKQKKKINQLLNLKRINKK